MAGLLTMGSCDATASAEAASDPVAAELRRWAREPFDLLYANCGLSVLDYVGRVTGQRVPSWLRAFGRVGVGRLMRRDRTFVAVAERALAEMGCSETQWPERGDVGLAVFIRSGLTAAICTGPLWAARGDRETVVERASPVRSWRLPCPRP